MFWGFLFGDHKMKEEVNWHGQRYEMEWFDEFDNSLLENLQQVYGVLFTEEGKICIVNPKRSWRLPGGSPEKEDNNWKDTVVRETREEADLMIDKDTLKILGIIKITPKSENCERVLVML